MMGLGKKIIIMATLVVLGMQCLSCVLEIGFLYRRIESGHLSKYALSGTMIKRKLERSLLYGKKIEKLNYLRLLKGLVADDISDLVVVDGARKPLYFLRNEVKKNSDVIINPELVAEKKRTFKQGRYYVMAFPLLQNNQLEGNLYLYISNEGIRAKVIPIIKEVIIKFFIVLFALIFLLYLILHKYMEKPFGQYIDMLRDAIVKKNKETLNTSGVKMKAYFEIEQLIDTLRGDKWLENKGVKGMGAGYDECDCDSRNEMMKILEQYHDIFKGMRSETLPSNAENKKIIEILPWDKIDTSMAKFESLKKSQEFTISVQRMWREIKDKVFLNG